MPKKIVLLEFPEEAKYFLDYCKSQALSPNSFHIIALQPKVQAYLKKLGISYENTLPYFTNQEHDRALLKSEEWYKSLSAMLRIEDGTGIKETYTNTFLYFLRFYVHHFLMHVEILSSICRRHEVESIHACVYQNKVHSNCNPIIQEDDRYIGLIARRFAESRGITWKEIPTQLESRVEPNILKVLNRLTRGIEKFVSVIYKVLILNLNRNKKVILLASTGYNIENLVGKLQTKFPAVGWVAVSREKPSRSVLKFIYFRALKFIKASKGCSIMPVPLELFDSASPKNVESRQILEKSLEQLLEKLKVQVSFFDHEGVNFLEIFLDKVQKDLKLYIMNLHNDSAAVREIMKSFNVKLCISPFARETALLVGELCQKKGIPTLMISHGTLKKPENEIEEIEYRHLGESLILSRFFNYIAVQTPNEEKICRHYNCKNNLLRTGSLIFSKIDIKNKEKYRKEILKDISTTTRILVYPENTRLRHNVRFHVFETFDEFLSSATDLVNAINEIENVHLVIRLHPGREVTPEEFKLLLPQSDKLTIVSHKRPFFEILSIADVVLNFSSTAIEDALQNHIPVVLYDKRNRYAHCYEAEKLNFDKIPELNAVYYINGTVNLKRSIQWIIENHIDKNVSKSIFDKYVFQEDYFNNLVEFFDNKINK